MGLFDLLKQKREQKQLERLQKQLEIQQEKERLALHRQYLKEVRNPRNNYQKNVRKIETKWSVMNNMKDFGGQRGKEFEKLCIQNIDDLRKYVEIEVKYKKELPTKAPAFKRLAMLYEKWKEYEKAASVCRMYLQLGMRPEKMDARMVRMIKKAGRTPTEEELKIIVKL